MRRMRRLKSKGTFKLWRNRLNQNISKANVWHVRGKGCGWNFNMTDGTEVTTVWYNEQGDIQAGTEQTGKSVKLRALIYNLEQTI